MPHSKLKQAIIQYCASNGIVIPAGFRRHPPARYVVIRSDLDPPKLVAATWLTQADLTYYLGHFLLAEIGEEAIVKIQILDFDSAKRFRFDPPASLRVIGHFEVNQKGAPS